MKNKLLFLGTGSSAGVPKIGCDCSVCTSKSPYNKRFRPSVLLQVGQKNILVDAGPDFRDQALRHNIKHLSAVILTHTHYDHIGGLDDLRIFYFIEKKPIHCLLSSCSYEEIKLRFYYQFLDNTEDNSKSVKFEYLVLPQDRGEIDFHGLHIQYLTYQQGEMPVLGLRMGNLAYITDIRTYPETIFEDLKGIDTLIVSALRQTPSPIHFNLEESLAFAEKTGCKKVYFNHIDHELDHEKTNRSLPSWAKLSYDGQVIEFE